MYIVSTRIALAVAIDTVWARTFVSGIVIYVYYIINATYKDTTTNICVGL